LSKVAIILQAGPGTHETHARMFHALIYTKELHERQHDVRLVFDGASTEWLARWDEPSNEDDQRMGAIFEGLKASEVVYMVCDFCAGSFGVRDTLATHGEPLTGEYLNHPSIAELVESGYQLLTL